MSRVAQMALLSLGAPPAATITYQGFTTAPVPAGDVCTASACPIGAAASRTRVFCIVHWYGGAARTLASATIGGVAAVIHAQALHTYITSGAGVAIISAVVPTGTTADVVGTITAGSSSNHFFAASFSSTGVLSATPVDTISTAQAGSVSTSYSGTIDVTNNGILLTGFGVYYDTTWTVGGATRDYHQAINPSLKAIGGSLAVTATEANRAITLTGSTGGNKPPFGVACASFR